jgi:6-phosphogluconate dehydrogenase
MCRPATLPRTPTNERLNRKGKLVANNTFGIYGLGSMGGNLALQALDRDIAVAGYTRSGADDELRQAGLDEVQEPGGFKDALEAPRIVMIYVPAGPIVDTVIEQLSASLAPGDIIVDGSNSYWGDSIRRAKRLKEKGFFFVDAGTSGGVDGARHGACFMIGGEDEAVAHVGPVLQKLAVEGGYVHAGPPGAGHFVKLVHNGIEFGMLQAIGEGIDLLTRYHQELPIANVLACWRNGSVIRSWLIELMEEIYRQEGGLEDIPAYIEDTGEVNWLVHDAMQLEVPIPAISQSVMQLFASRDADKKWARAIAMMRHGFGGHPFGEDESIKKERREGRVGPFYSPDGSEGAE